MKLRNSTFIFLPCYATAGSVKADSRVFMEHFPNPNPLQINNFPEQAVMQNS